MSKCYSISMGMLEYEVKSYQNAIAPRWAYSLLKYEAVLHKILHSAQGTGFPIRSFGCTTARVLGVGS